ncbi:MAG TPA: hypothetical protein VN969_26595 [Streptosporangiaceae bacterium]|jgi:hypothetical protein|nr:hypothetical protein [Streptosporangiaceae bacterium]
MAAKLTERQVVPFHLTLTEPIGETSIAGYPAAEGAYDPVEQIWKLPDGTALSDSNAREIPFIACESYSIIQDMHVIDDIHVE